MKNKNRSRSTFSPYGKKGGKKVKKDRRKTDVHGPSTVTLEKRCKHKGMTRNSRPAVHPITSGNWAEKRSGADEHEKKKRMQN